MVLNIAKAGIFNRPDATPLRSAELANIYEAYQYLTHEAEMAAAKQENQ